MTTAITTPQGTAPMKKYLSFEALEFKVLDAEQGIIEAIVSVFNKPDRGRDRVKVGAFTKSLQRKFPKGVWMHQWDQPIAKTLEAAELAPMDKKLPDKLKMYGGLYIKGQFNLETQRGREAFSDVKNGIIDEFSFGYGVVSEKMADDGYNDLLELDIYEWSPVLWGMHPDTAVISAKSLGNIQTKGEHLGRYVETYALMAAFDAISLELTWKMWDLGCDLETPKAERAAKLGPMLDEFKTITLNLFDALATDPTGSPLTKQMAEKMRVKAMTSYLESSAVSGASRVVTPEVLLDALAAGAKTLKDHLATYDEKEGRTFSSANVDRIGKVADVLEESAKDLREMLDSATVAKAADGATNNDPAPDAAKTAATGSTAGADPATPPAAPSLKHAQLALDLAQATTKEQSVAILQKMIDTLSTTEGAESAPDGSGTPATTGEKTAEATASTATTSDEDELRLKGEALYQQFQFLNTTITDHEDC